MTYDAGHAPYILILSLVLHIFWLRTIDTALLLVFLWLEQCKYTPFFLNITNNYAGSIHAFFQKGETYRTLQKPYPVCELPLFVRTAQKAPM